MNRMYSKTTRILVGIFSTVVQISNLFLGNIIVYESTSKMHFDWERLLKNPLFWIVIILTFVYYSIPLIVQQTSNEIDKDIEQAIKNGTISLYRNAVKKTIDGNYEGAQKTLKVLKKIQKRR